MKVLHIINSLATGGAEKLIVETIPLLNEQGINTDVLLLNGTEYPFLQELKKTTNGKVFSLGNNSVYHPKHLISIIPVLRNYDIVHVHLFPALYFVALAKITSRSNVKLVFTEHNTSNKRIGKSLYKIPEKLIYSQYTKLICITEEIRSIMQTHLNISPRKITVIENGVNLETISDAKKIDFQKIDDRLNSNDFILLMTAGFREQKDQPTLIKALKYLPTDVKLLLAGDGPLRKDCENLVKELQLQNRVFFLGIRSNIPELLKSVDAVVLSSKYEGLSLSSIEGMASGKPFLASNVPGLSEIVGGAGILFPQGDSKNLAEEIKKLMENPNHYAETVGKCQERASKYDVTNMVNKTIDLYEEILEIKR